MRGDEKIFIDHLQRTEQCILGELHRNSNMKQTRLDRSRLSALLSSGGPDKAQENLGLVSR